MNEYWKRQWSSQLDEIYNDKRLNGIERKFMWQKSLEGQRRYLEANSARTYYETLVECENDHVAVRC